MSDVFGVARGRALRPGLAVGATAMALAIAACSAPSSPLGGSLAGAVSARTSPPPPSGSSRPAVELGAVEAMYGSFWSVLTTFDPRYPEARWRTVLGTVSTEPQLSQAVAAAKEQRRNGIVLYGQPDPRTPQVALRSGRRGTVTDCVDFSRSGQADRRTGQRRTVGRARTPVRLTVTKTASGWRVATVAFPGGEC